MTSRHPLTDNKSSHATPPERQNTLIEISVPALIQIKLVPANELRHYEISGWFASLFSSAAVGFWTAYILDTRSPTLKWTSLVFTFFTIAFVVAAAYYRSQLKTDGVKKVASMEDFKTK